MRLITLKKNTWLSSLASARGLEAAELMRINDIERPGLLPPGLSLLLPEEAPSLMKKTELFVCGTGRNPGPAASAIYFPVSFADYERCPAPPEDAGAALPLLALRNTDESGFLSARLAHELFADGEPVRHFSQTLANRLEAEGWGGLLLSMEYLFPFDRQAYTDFVRSVEKAVHKAGCWLILSLPSAALLSPESRSGAAYDIRSLAGLCDRLILTGESLWDAPALEACVSRLARHAPPGKALIHLSPLSHISRPGHTSPISGVAAHNLAISVRAEVYRSGPCAPACFDYTDPTGQPCHVCYADPLWFCTLLEKLQSFGLGGISCPELQSLCPGAGALFSGIFPVESLI